LTEQVLEESSSPINFGMVIRKIDEENHIIAGYANVGDIVDNQNELITIDALKNAWKKFWGNRKFAHINLMHSNIPVGEVLEKFTEKDGTVHTSGVDNTGLYIISKIRDDIKKGKETWDMIKRGVLKAYSIAGEALKRLLQCEGDNCYKQINELELHEISIVDTPANKPSTFTILKRDEGMEEYLEEIVLVEDFATYEIEYEDSELSEETKNEWIEKGLWNPLDFDEDGFKKGVLSTEARAKIPKTSFACTTASGEKKLPIHDAAHVRNAMARYNQAQGCQTAAVKAKICRAAKRFGIEGGTFCGKTKKSLVFGKPFAGYPDMAACIRDQMKKNPKYTKEQVAGTCAKIHYNALGRYPSQKSEDAISYDLALIRSKIPVQRVLPESGESGLVSQDGGASERTPILEENVGSQIKIRLKGDAKWVKQLLKTQN